MTGASIHLLHLKEHSVGSPNLYLNLARLFASTDWVLIIPGELDSPVPQRLDDIVSSRTKTIAREYVLASGIQSYPFPELSPLLIYRDRDFWCTERIMTGTSRRPDWDECLWQLNLETAGAIQGLDVSMVTSKDDRNLVSEVCFAIEVEQN